jgi:hypothetical protein
MLVAYILSAASASPHHSSSSQDPSPTFAISPQLFSSLGLLFEFSDQILHVLGLCPSGLTHMDILPPLLKAVITSLSLFKFYLLNSPFLMLA